MPPPAINTGLFVTRWTDLHLDEFHYPLNDGGSKPAFGRRSDSAANVRYGSFASFEASNNDVRYYPERRHSLALQYLSQRAICVISQCRKAARLFALGAPVK
jgi:hypothetical protein